MLAKKHRLTPDWVIDKVKRRGRKTKSRYASLAAQPRRRSGVSRFCFITPLRVSKLAVERNRLRRQAGEIVKKDLPDIRPGHDYVLTLRPPVLKLKFVELRQAIREIFSRGNYLERS